MGPTKRISVDSKSKAISDKPLRRTPPAAISVKHSTSSSSTENRLPRQVSERSHAPRPLNLAQTSPRYPYLDFLEAAESFIIWNKNTSAHLLLNTAGPDSKFHKLFKTIHKHVTQKGPESPIASPPLSSIYLKLLQGKRKNGIVRPVYPEGVAKEAIAVYVAADALIQSMKIFGAVDAATEISVTSRQEWNLSALHVLVPLVLNSFVEKEIENLGRTKELWRKLEKG
ncbi:hypothetical protein B0J14DRAFT_669892 [Halenospora varia]|nr:hypothetical protein B0J14DRAFT_669892 [Halenospora varia]